MDKQFPLASVIENVHNLHVYDMDCHARADKSLRDLCARLGQQGRQVSPMDLSDLESRIREFQNTLREAEKSGYALSRLSKVQVPRTPRLLPVSP